MPKAKFRVFGHEVDVQRDWTGTAVSHRIQCGYSHFFKQRRLPQHKEQRCCVPHGWQRHGDFPLQCSNRLGICERLYSQNAKGAKLPMEDWSPYTKENFQLQGGGFDMMMSSGGVALC